MGQLKPGSIPVYLEHALKEVRPTLPRPTASLGAEILNEAVYLDYVDFIEQSYADIKKIKEILKKKGKVTRTRQSTY